MTDPVPGVRDHAPPGPERLLAGLTAEQAQAVTFGSGPLLLLAGGSAPPPSRRSSGWAREHHVGDLIAASARAADLDGLRSQAARGRLGQFGGAPALIHVEV